MQGVQSLKSILGNKERGSNNWVVSGSHTQSGAAMLANDPHLQLTSPAIWYYAHLVASDDNIDVEGVSFAGLPAITLGFTKDIAWGATVTNYDVTDFYQLDTVSIAGSGALTAVDLDGICFDDSSRPLTAGRRSSTFPDRPTPGSCVRDSRLRPDRLRFCGSDNHRRPY